MVLNDEFLTNGVDGLLVIRACDAILMKGCRCSLEYAAESKSDLAKAIMGQ